MYLIVISGHVNFRKMLPKKRDKNNEDEQKLKISKKKYI